MKILKLQQLALEIRHLRFFYTIKIKEDKIVHEIENTNSNVKRDFKERWLKEIYIIWKKY